jgi:hypothetical protein
MRLRHATPSRNLSSILQHGLLCRMSKGRLPAVWFHAPSQTSWAILHTVRRHGGRVETVIILTVDVPRRWLRRSRKGLWFSVRDLPPERLRQAFTFAEVARSPVESTT